MFRFGRKKLPMAIAAMHFVDHVCQKIIHSLPGIRDAIDMFGGGSEALDDKQLYAEVFPAVLAIGLQPVRKFGVRS